MTRSRCIIFDADGVFVCSRKSCSYYVEFLSAAVAWRAWRKVLGI